MKRFLWGILCSFICIQLTGCSGWVVRTSSSHKARVDQEVSGNRGFIFGSPTSAPKEPAFTDRKVYRVELEIPNWAKKEKLTHAKKKSTIQPPEGDTVLWGNRGYIFVGPAEKQVTKEVPETMEEIVEEMPEAKEEVAEQSPKTWVFEEEPVQELIKEEKPQIVRPKLEKTSVQRTYKVKKGDTLQKISRKFYGTTKKWILLYKTNKNKLKNPDSIYPGQVLVIPEGTN